MKSILIILMLFQFGSGLSQDFTYPIVKKEGQKITDFIPNGWAIHDSANGDLNNDKIKDLAMVLQRKDSITIFKNVDGLIDTVKTLPRILVILFRDNSKNKYILVEQSNSFILSSENPSVDDPFQSIKIVKEILLLEFRIFSNVGSWYTTNSIYRFRFQNNSFNLIGADNNSIYKETLDYQYYTYNFIAEKWCMTEGNADEESTQKVKTECYSLELKELKTFKTFTQPYTWEITSGIYL